MTRAPIRIVPESPDRSILVTGGEAFVRARLCRLLADDPAMRVVALAGDPTPGGPSGHSNFREIIGSPTDTALVSSLLIEARIDTVVHLSAPADRTDADEAGMAAAHRLFEAVAGHWQRLPGGLRAAFRLVDVATDASFGGLPPDRDRFNAATPLRPTSPGAAVEAASLLVARGWASHIGLPVVTAVHGNLYGPGQDAEAFIPRTILTAASGQPIEIRGTGAETRDWMHVDDAVAALRLVLLNGRPGNCYPLGARAERSRIALAATICDVLDRLDPWPDGRRRRSLIRFVAGEPDPDRCRAIDPADTERALGWQAEQPFTAGLAATVDWYLASGMARRPAMATALPR